MTNAEPTAGSSRAPHRPMRTLFVNENLGGHASMHLYLRQALAQVRELDGDFVARHRAWNEYNLAIIPSHAGRAIGKAVDC